MQALDSDEDLLAACASGSASAFGSLVDRYREVICAITYCGTGDLALSEDLAQDTFVAAWRGLPRLEDRRRFRPWLCTIARNLARNARRDRARVIVTDAPPEVARDPEMLAVERADEEATVWRVLETMPSPIREPLVLFYREGRPAAEIAEMLGLSVAAVEQRLSRGRRRLREQVETLVESTLVRSRPGAGFTAAVLAGVTAGTLPTTDAIAATEAATILNPATASTKGTIMSIVIKSIVVTGSAAALAYGCATWTPDHTSAAVDVDVDDDEASAPRSAAAIASDATGQPAKRDPIAEHRAARERSRDDADDGGATLPEYRLTRFDDGRVAVALDGGVAIPTEADKALARKPLSTDAVRRLSGRVLDDAGRPAVGAVVLAGSTVLGYEMASIVGEVGAVTDRNGRFTLTMPHDKSVAVLAFHRVGWSPVHDEAAGTADARIDLRLDRPAALRGTLEYDGAPHLARVVVQRGESFLLISTGPEDGSFALPQLPPGKAEVMVLPFDSSQKLRSASKSIDLLASRTARWDVTIAGGPLVAITPRLPEQLAGSVVSVGMLPGRVIPKDPVQWKAQIDAVAFSERHWTPVDVAGIGPVAEFEGVAAGPWTVCAEAQPSPREAAVGFACVVIDVSAQMDFTAHDLEIAALGG